MTKQDMEDVKKIKDEALHMLGTEVDDKLEVMRMNSETIVRLANELISRELTRQMDRRARDRKRRSHDRESVFDKDPTMDCGY